MVEFAISEVLECADEVLKIGAAGQSDDYANALDRYLEKLEGWCSVQREAIGEPKSVDTALVEALAEMHKKITNITLDHCIDIETRINQMGVKAKALRTYIDQFPSRVSITGNRKV